ncbi:hypothetical protein [Actinomadura sp. BRA 177]|uniref:glycine-rich domain-containing protein n=1 Tax=Actinomadura sp. BRA 177 TaxID=2745202 RepID=UPI001595D3D3|nr:hypothetical protein [Actinomadura sp. BRA 177]NVI91238.1 hypothetical protein [Actinomadura sp. BRA 177]
MTRTTEWTALAAHDPRELVDDGLFTKLSAYVAKDQGVTRAYAEGVVGQALVWLRAVAENPGVRLAMSETVDPGWHAFLLHSQDYTRWCEEHLGYYLHHIPPAPGVTSDEDEIARTLPALNATGYRVDTEHWADAAYPCCPPNPCVAKVIEQAKAFGCDADTGAPPPAADASGPRSA